MNRRWALCCAMVGLGHLAVVKPLESAAASAPRAASGSATGLASAQPSLALAIVPPADAAAPIEAARGFQVALSNVGDQPVRVWRDSCSWGHENLSFELRDDGGAVTTVRRRPITWEKNFPDWAMLAPGERLLFDVTLEPSGWLNLPALKPGEWRSVTLRAIYRSVSDRQAQLHRVWAGKVVSAPVVVAIRR
ncbi:MAG: hypothetical protein JNK55_07440 [Rubrivivax sp.]|nr:hypothetical protein [Rubrivivax sp.]